MITKTEFLTSLSNEVIYSVISHREGHFLKQINVEFTQKVKYVIKRIVQLTEDADQTIDLVRETVNLDLAIKMV